MCIKPKIKKKSWFVKLFTCNSIIGITLAPFGIYLRDDIYDKQSPQTINHEKIHWYQQLEMLIIFFYIWYLTEWIIRLFINTKEAYHSISFEREAYANDKNEDYLKTRKPFSWLKYIIKRQG